MTLFFRFLRSRNARGTDDPGNICLSLFLFVQCFIFFFILSIVCGHAAIRDATLCSEGRKYSWRIFHVILVISYTRMFAADTFLLSRRVCRNLNSFRAYRAMKEARDARHLSRSSTAREIAAAFYWKTKGESRLRGFRAADIAIAARMQYLTVLATIERRGAKRARNLESLL